MSYAYNEARMLEGIRAFREEKKPSAVQAVPLKPQASERVIMRTAKKFAMMPEAILSRCNEPHFIRAREVIVLILRKEYGYSLERTAYLMGRRHHTTVLHAQRNAQMRYETNPEFKAIVDSIADGPLTMKRDDLGIPIA